MKLTNYISTAALMLSISACSNENDLTAAFYDDADAVKINATIGEGIPITRSNPIGTPEEQAKFKSGDQIAVAAGTQAAVTYQYNGTAWTPVTAGAYLKWETTPMDFNAYYPVGNGISMDAFTLPTDQNTLEKLTTADYMTCTATGVTKADNINLTLQRKTARIVISGITLNDQFKEGYTVSDIKVSGNSTGYTGGAVKTGSTQVTSYLTGTGADSKFYALLTPTTADATATFLTLTVKKTADNTTQELLVKGIPATEAGKSYTYTLAVGKDLAQVGNVTVENWTDGTPIQGGEAIPLVEVAPATHTLTLHKAGALTAEHITAALNGGTTLTVNGTSNVADMTLLAATTSLTAIDLRGMNYSGTSGTLGEVPSADWAGCTNLTKILINADDAGAYKTAWSAATGKLFYLGKTDYSHTALDGTKYTCKVISLSTSTATVVYLTKQPTAGVAPARAAAQAELNKRGARFLKKAEFEKLVLDKTITVSTTENIFCHEDCAGYYTGSKFGYQATSTSPDLQACYFLVFDI